MSRHDDLKLHQRAIALKRAELAVLSGLLAHPERLHEVTAVLDAEDFAMESHRIVFGIIRGIAAAGRLPGPDREERGAYESEVLAAAARNPMVGAGEIPDIINASAFFASGADVVRQAEFVAIEGQRRRLQNELREKLQRLDEVDDPNDEAQVLASNLQVLTQGRGAQQDRTAEDLAEESLDALHRRMVEAGTAGLETGIEHLDRYMRLLPGRVYVVAARPGVGKSALAARFIQATGQAARWGVFSLEMEPREWTDRLICSEGRINVQRYMLGDVEDPEIDRAMAAELEVKKLRYTIDARSGLTWSQIESKAQQWHMNRKLDALVIDYLGLVKKGHPSASTYDHVTEVSKAVKSLARRLKVPVVLLAQLNREGERRQDKRPILSDLRDSGSIEQDADVVLMLYRDSEFNGEADPEEVEILVRKNRIGPKNVTAYARWQGEYTRFTSWGAE